jgi:tRNA A37 methylthiotransferase MiaB
MKDNVTKTEKKRREDELNKILSKTCLENNIPYLGKEVEVLLSGKNKKGEWMGYTRTLKKVKVKNIKAKTNIDLTGKFVFVKITKVKDFGMEGKMVEVSPPKADPPLAESKN